MRSENSTRFPLAGRTALITGSAGVIGRALVDEFARAGARIVVADLSQEQCDELALKTKARYGVETIGLGVDLTDSASTAIAAERISQDFGVCDALVINAGILTLKPFLDLSSDDWEKTISVNLTGAFNTAQSFGRFLIASQKPGTMVFSSSLFGVRGGAGNAAYSASKFGIIGLAQSMAADLAPHNVRVNAVCPGQIDTAMLDQLFAVRASQNGTSADQEKSQFVKRIPLGSLGRVDEIASVYKFLSSDESSYITGQSIVVDGGWQVG